MSKGKNFYTEFKASVILLLSLVLFVLFFHYISKSESFFIVFWKSVLIYLAIISIFAILNPFLKNKFFNKIIEILSLPLAILFVILTIIIPYGAIFIHLLMYAGIVFIVPELIIRILNYFNVISFVTDTTILYLKISSIAILCVMLNNLLRKMIYRISPYRLKSSEKMKPFELDRLTDYVLSKNNIRLILYASYIVVLIVANYHSFQNVEINKNLETNNIILQSFATFIAFDTANSLFRQNKFKPSELLGKIWIPIKSTFSGFEEN